jgi:hypothetical protein
MCVPCIGLEYTEHPLVPTLGIAVSFRVNQHSLRLFGYPCE